MKLYDHVIPGEFLVRPNRFIAQVKTASGVETCHVKNTGRCAELLVPGARVMLVAVEKGKLLINMDSQAPNRGAGEALPWLFPGLTLVQPEKVCGESRLDFYVEVGPRKIYMEVKGVTLEREGVALFPDAPTLRGVKHLGELEKCVAAGYEAALLLVIQMKGITRFSPNWHTHAAFGDALLRAKRAGVAILAYDCLVTPDSMTLDRPVELRLER